MTDFAEIPIEDVAEDMRPLIIAFREAGAVSFQDVPIDGSRANYEMSCARNGLAPEHLAVVRDHIVDVDGGTITVREYRAHEERVQPAILFVHGGGWVIGSLDTHDPICRFIAKHTDAAVFSVDYRLAPEFPFPTPLNDVSAALRWLVSLAEGLSIDPEKLAIVGDSAGGNMAAVVANSEWLRPDGTNFVGQALLYPVTDLRGVSSSYGRVAAGVPLTARSMHWFRDHYLAEERDLSDPLLSPLLTNTICRAPMFLVSCGLDPLSDEGIAYASFAAQSGVRVEHHHLPNHAHGLFTSAGKVGTGHRFVTRLSDFLTECFSAVM